MTKNKKRQRKTLFGDFVVDMKISNMFGKNLLKETNIPFDRALDQMLEFDEFQNKGKKRRVRK